MTEELPQVNEQTLTEAAARLRVWLQDGAAAVPEAELRVCVARVLRDIHPSSGEALARWDSVAAQLASVGQQLERAAPAIARQFEPLLAAAAALRDRAGELQFEVHQLRSLSEKRKRARATLREKRRARRAK